MNNAKFMAMMMTGAGLVALAQPAWAQQAQGAAPEADAASTPESSGDIIVTAQKRSERLQDVPLAVSAVTADALSRQQINDTQSVTRAVPSLTFQQGQGSQSNGFRIRGVGSQLFSLGVEASVSVVVDGVVSARATQGFSDFADIERIEVLRGPQGTLFGKNATAGVVSVVTARPTDHFEGSAEATIAEQDEYRIKGTVSGPLSDTLRARVSGYYNDVGGYIYNVGTGRDVNGSESWGLRGKLDWDATENLNFLLTGDYRKNEALCCQSVTVALTTPTVIELTEPVIASPDNRQINDDLDSYNNERQYTISLEGNLDLGSATVTSITAYQNYKNASNNVVDRIYNPVPVYTGGNAQFNQNGGTIDLEQFSQELRIASNGDRDLNYVVGAYYSNVTVDRYFLRRIANCAAGTIGDPCAAPVYLSVSSDARNKAESGALFGQVEYRVAGGLKLLGGIRVQRETTSVDGGRNSPSPLFPTDSAIPGFGTISGRQSVSDTAVTGKAGAKYEFSRNAQVYATYTRGYKGYGFNTEPATNFATQTPVAPEHVNAYEIGFKGKTSDNLLNVSIAAFWSDYTNLQVLANVGTPAFPAFAQTNAGSSRTRGFEIEGNLRPSDQFSVGFGLTYADSSVNAEGISCPLQNQGVNALLIAPGETPPPNTCYRTTATAAGQQNIVDGYLPYAPKLRINVSPRFESDIPGTQLAGFAQVNVSYQSKQYFAIEQDPLLMQKAYTLVDASIGVKTADSGYSLTLFVRNLFDQNYYTSMAHTNLLSSATNANDLTAFVNKDSNRYFGGTIGVRF